MTEERQYRRDKNSNGRKKAAIIIAAMVIIAIIIICSVKRHAAYDSYKTESRIRRNDNGYVEYVYFAGKTVRCSKDGIASFNDDGEALWNSTYEINNMSVESSGRYLAIADINGNKIYTYDGDGYITEIITALPILQISVAGDGYVAVILEDKNAEYVSMYSVNGEKIYTIKKTIEMDGVPVSISVSKDGEKLAAAFTGINGTELSTSVVFYNFNEVGQNENERVVGGFDYGNEIVGCVRFVDDSTVIAVSEKSLSIFSMVEYPKLVKKITFDYETEYVFTGKSHVGIIHKEEDREILEVYNMSGKLVQQKETDGEYTTYKFSGSSILMYNDSECLITDSRGKKIFSYTFDDGITDIIPLQDSKEFILIDKEYIRKIKLK